METEQKTKYHPYKKWVPGIALGVALYFMYASTFLTDYLMNDEWAHLGSHVVNLYNLALQFIIFNSRPLFGIANAFVFEFVDFNPFKIQLIRFLNFLSLAGMALILWRFLAKRSRHSWFSFFVILFFFSQTSVLGLQGYSLVFFAEATPAIWLNFLAFFLFFFLFDARRIHPVLQAAAIFLLFAIAMLFIQTYAFVSMIPLSYLALTDWPRQKRRIVSFYIIAAAVLLIASGAFQIILRFSGAQGIATYPVAKQAFDALRATPLEVIRRAFSPLTYWNAFELWTYPFPFHGTPPLSLETRKTGATIVTRLWVVLIAAAIIVETKERPHGERREIIFKWLSVAVAMGFGMIFILIDSPTEIIDHRPHMMLPMTGVIIFSGAYSLQVLATKYKVFHHRLLQGAAAFLILYIAFGAQADLERGIVSTRHAQLDFIRTTLASRPPDAFEKVIVVLPPNTQGCVSEPCNPWFGQIVHSHWHLRRTGIYHYAFVSEGIMPGEKELVFSDHPLDAVPENAVVIDWNQFVQSREKLRNFLRWLRKETFNPHIP